MFHNVNSAQDPAFRGFWVHSLKTSDKVLKYGENNKVDFSEHPTVVKRGSVRTINIYAAVPVLHRTSLLHIEVKSALKILTKVSVRTKKHAI